MGSSEVKVEAEALGGSEFTSDELIHVEEKMIKNRSSTFKGLKEGEGEEEEEEEKRRSRVSEGYRQSKKNGL